MFHRFQGDGAGVGKGRSIAGLIYENHLEKRKKAVWVSVSNDLKLDAERDLNDIGASDINVASITKVRCVTLFSMSQDDLRSFQFCKTEIWYVPAILSLRDCEICVYETNSLVDTEDPTELGKIRKLEGSRPSFSCPFLFFVIVKREHHISSIFPFFGRILPGNAPRNFQ